MNARVFDPRKLADLAAFAQSLRPRLAPLLGPIVLDDQSYAWLPVPDGSDQRIGCYVHAGVRLNWIATPELNGIVVAIWGGPAAEEGFEEEGVAALLTRKDLCALIADLQSIDAQLGTGE